MEAVKYDEWIDEEIKRLTSEEKKEVFDFVEFIKLKRLKGKDIFQEALQEGQEIGKRLGITPKDIEREIKNVRDKRK